jgi:hypothetical protein
MNKYLSEALSKLSDSYNNREKRFKELQAQSLEEQVSLSNEIMVLEQRLRELIQKQRHYEEESAALAEERSKQTLQLVRKSLEQSALSLASTATFLETRMKIKAAYKNLIEAHPDLEARYRDYMDMETRRHMLPESYLKFHEEQKQRLEPYLKLKKMEQGLKLEETIYLQIALAIDKKEETSYWLLPMPEEDQLPGQNREVIGDALIEALANSIIHLATDPDWYLSDIVLNLVWFDFPALATPFEYKGEDPLEDSAQKIFHDYFATESIFHGCMLDVDVALVSMEIWQQGQPDAEPALPEPQEIETELEDLSTLAERSEGFYSEEDVVSWERPLRTAEGSIWNIQGRRLRTLLISLVSKGLIGKDGVPKTKLFEPLPKMHRDQMQEGLELLITNEILLEKSENGEELSVLTINPERLDDVQTLINRDITEAWASIIQ